MYLEGLDKRFVNCSMDNYEINNENKYIFDLLKNYKHDESLTFLKNTGAGKTHLAIALLTSHPQCINEHSEVVYDKLIYKIRHPQNDEEKKHNEFLIESESYKYRPARCLFIPVIRLLMELNEATYKNEKLFYLKKYTEPDYFDMICLDDLGTERNSEAAQQNIYYILDERYRKCLNTIITSNLTLKEIDKYDPRIASRLSEMGKVIEFNCSDYRTRKK
jgi:DNA replication protein DnaC